MEEFTLTSTEKEDGTTMTLETSLRYFGRASSQLRVLAAGNCYSSHASTRGSLAALEERVARRELQRLASRGAVRAASSVALAQKVPQVSRL